MDPSHHHPPTAPVAGPNNNCKSILHSGSSPDSNNSSMHNMPMGFIASTVTLLYGRAFVPSSFGDYVGICIFLILLGFTARLLIALKHVMERRWTVHENNRRAQYYLSSDLSHQTKWTCSGIWARPHGRSSMEWCDLIRALMMTVITGVEFLL